MKYIALALLLGLVLVGCGGGGSGGKSGGETPPVVDSTPDNFAFSAQTEVPLGVTLDSAPIIIRGINTASEVKVSGALYQINGGAFVDADGLVNNGDAIVLRVTSALEFATEVSATLTVGGVTARFTVTTASVADEVPDEFTINPVDHTQLNAFVESGVVTISGFNVPVSISVEGGEYAIAGGAFIATPGVLSPAQTLVVRHTSAAEFLTATETTLTVGGISAVFRSTTAAIDTTPDAFTFVNQTNVGRSALITSAPVTITGISVPAAVSVAGGSYAIGDGPFTDEPGIINNGDVVSVQHISASDYSTATSTTLTVGGVNGVFQTATGPIGAGFNQATGFDGEVFDVAAAADGSGDFYVVGNFSIYNDHPAGGILRFNADGSIDHDFVVTEGFGVVPYVVVPVKDGSGDIYVGGSFDTYNGVRSPTLIRLNSDGTADLDFVVGTTGFGTVKTVNDIALAEDNSGDIYVVGDFETYQGESAPRIIRLNSNGSIDLNFNPGSGFNDAVFEVLPVKNGSGDVYVTTVATAYNGSSIAGVVRLNSNGSIDTAFNTGTGFDRAVLSITLATDGSNDIFVGGNFDQYNGIESEGVVRLRSTGSLNTTYQANREITQLSVNRVVSTNDGTGDVYVSGSFSGPYTDILRINGNGSFDESFQHQENFDGRIRNMSVYEDGKVFVAGNFTRFNGTSVKGVVLLNPDATVDPRIVNAAAFDTSVTKLIVPDDGSKQVYALGEFDFYRNTYLNGLGLLNSDGIEIASYTLSDLLLYGPDDASLVGDGSGSLYVIGRSGASSPSVLLRVDNEGNVDDTFTVELESRYARKVAAASDGSGDIYVAIQSDVSSDVFIRRFNSNGTLDTQFAPVGGFSMGSVKVLQPALDGSGDLYVGGDFELYAGAPSNRIIRLNSNGSVDENFAVGMGFNREINSIAPALDGSGELYVGGHFSQYQEQSVRGVVRLNANGSRDSSFNSSGYSFVQVITPLHDGSGRIYLGGSDILRLRSDGSVDTGFATGEGFDGRVYTLAIAQDGSNDVFVGGTFNRYQNTTVDYVARLNPDGTLN